jgi:hypothetical protein
MNYRRTLYDAPEENPYAVQGLAGNGAPFQRGNYGGSMAADFKGGFVPAPVQTVGRQAGEGAGEHQSRIQDYIQAAGEATVKPVREGFRAIQDAQGVMAGEGEAAAEAMGQLGNQALKGQAGYIDAFQQQLSWTNRELRNIQAANEQKADSRKGSGGLIGAIGGIAGSLIGGPIGKIVGGVSGLFD